MKISFIVPFYKVEHYLGQCLESLITQTLQEIEILLIDDCSPDGSLAIAESYVERDGRIKIIKHSQNKGQGGARNTGLEQARGEYIWFVDSDDYLASPKVAEELYNNIKASGAEILKFSIARFYEESDQLEEPCKESWCYLEKEGLYQGQEAIAQLFANPDPIGLVWDKLWQRTFLVEKGFNHPERLSHQDSFDIPFILMQAETFYCCSRVIGYVYRIRPFSVTTSQVPANLYLNNIGLIQHCYNYAKIHKIEQKPRIKAILVSYCYHLLLNRDKMKQSYKLANKTEQLLWQKAIYKQFQELEATPNELEQGFKIQYPDQDAKPFVKAFSSTPQKAYAFVHQKLNQGWLNYRLKKMLPQTLIKILRNWKRKR